MPKPDPTGYDAALEAIQPGLNTREQTIAVALAMIDEGVSIKAAAERCQLPYATLWRYARKVSELNSDATDGRTASLEALADQTLVAARIAAERVTQRLVDDDHEWRDSDLIKATQVMADKASQLASRPKHEESGISALRELLGAGDITISAKKPGDEAIDVTPEETE